MLARALPLRSVGALSSAQRAALACTWRAMWVSRLLVWASGTGAALALGVSGRRGAFDPSGLTSPFGAAGNALAAPFARWDSVWYLSIAGHGYGNGNGAREAFFPLYPLAVRAAGAVLGSQLVGGALLSTAALAVALYLLHRLVTLERGAVVAGDAVLVMALFPMAFFFSAVYSESLFLALSVGSFYAARTERWAWAGALGALAAGTRSAGVVLLVPLVLLYLWPHGHRPGRERPRWGTDAVWLALVPLGAVAYCAFLAAAGHGALAPFHAQDVWLRSFAGPFAGAWSGLVAAVDGARQLLSGSRSPVYFAAAGGDPFLVARHNLELFAWLVLGVAATIIAVRRLPLAYGAYVVAALALPLSYPVGPQPLMSLPRFEAVLFPLAVAVADWTAGRAVRRRVVIGMATAGLVLYTGVFATWHWVA